MTSFSQVFLVLFGKKTELCFTITSTELGKNSKREAVVNVFPANKMTKISLFHRTSVPLLIIGDDPFNHVISIFDS